MAVLTSDIIGAGLRLSGVMLAPGRGASPEEKTESLAILGDIIDQWNSQRYFVLSIGRKVFPLVPGQQHYELGPTGTDWVIDRPPKIEDASIIVPSPSSPTISGNTFTGGLGPFSRTLLVKDSTVGSNIADIVATEGPGIATSVLAVLRVPISSDLTIQINVAGVPIATMTIPASTGVGVVLTEGFTDPAPSILANQAVSWDILASDGQVASAGIASFTFIWQPSRPLGAGADEDPGLEIPLKMWTMDQWQLIAQKTSVATYPQAAWYNPAQEYLPNARFSLWPVPAAFVKVALYGWSQMTAPALITTPLLLAPGYKRALQYELAVELCIRWRRPVPPDVRAAQLDAVAKVKSVNAPTLDIRCDDALLPHTGGGWSGWNWIRG